MTKINILHIDDDCYEIRVDEHLVLSVNHEEDGRGSMSRIRHLVDELAETFNIEVSEHWGDYMGEFALEKKACLEIVSEIASEPELFLELINEKYAYSEKYKYANVCFISGFFSSLESDMRKDND